MKIYTSRVDSVATETGKLLSGLADGRDKRGREADADGDEEEEEGEDGTTRKSRKKVLRVSLCNSVRLAANALAIRLNGHMKLHWRRHSHLYN